MIYRALRPEVEPAEIVIAGHEVVHEQGEPEGDGVFHIERFDVPDRLHAEFAADCREARARLAGARGYLGARLYRDGDRFTEVARWSSPLMVHRARDLLPPEPALYQRSG